MGAWEIILIVACSALVIGVIVTRTIKRLKGKPTCDCDCGCRNCSSCKVKESNKK